MLISLRQVLERHGLRIGGSVHAGAHLGQEAEVYRSCGIADVLWIEANPALIDELRANVEPRGHRAVQACLGATSGARVTLNIADDEARTNRGLSSSLLPLGTHRDRHPEVAYVDAIELETRTLDSVAAEHGAMEWNLLVMDVQGYELQVLEGAAETLPHVDCVYSEVNVDELYEGCVLLPDLDAFLAAREFTRVETRLWGSQHRDERDGEGWFGWGDAVWVRTGLAGRRSWLSRVARARFR
jgi:FkbM family methyltransferase